MYTEHRNKNFEIYCFEENIKISKVDGADGYISPCSQKIKFGY